MRLDRVFIFTITFLIFLLSGCATDDLHREGINLLSEGRYEEGLSKLEQASQKNPSNVEYRSDVITKREAIATRLLGSADSERAGGRLDNAEAIYQRVLKIAPGNDRAKAGLVALQRDRRHQSIIAEAKEQYGRGDLAGAMAKIRLVATENPNNADMLALKRSIEERTAKDSMAPPELKPSNPDPVTLEFRDANLKMVFEVLSHASGINFILDKDIRPDQKTSLFVKDALLEDAIELILSTNQLGKRVLSPNTVLIYPNTPAKQREHQDLVIKSFYLSNADVKQTVTMIKTLLKSKDVYADEKLNLIIMRDTPDAIRLAEKLVALQDLGEPEVMLEVEVLEVKRSRLLALGIQWPNQLTLTAIPPGSNAATTTPSGATATPGTLTLNDLRNLSPSTIGASLTSMIINLKQENGTVNILANPRIRARNREKAKILIGDKVPVITTTSTSTGFVAENVQYVDVGLKLEVEPNIYLQDDVAIKVGLEVSSIVREIRSSSGTLSYQIGTRNANTVLRLKDGETQVLAGLISDEDRSTANKVPGLGELPILGRLFSSTSDDRQKTEIVLSITPRLVRNLKRPDSIAEEFWSGTEASLKASPLRSGRGGANNSSPKKIEPTVPTQVPNTPPPSLPAPGANAIDAVKFQWDGPKRVKVGEQISLALRMESGTPLVVLPLQIGFDSKMFDVVDIKEGAYFKQNGEKTNFSNNVDLPNGRIFAGISQENPTGTAGKGDVVNVVLKAKAPGRGNITLVSASPSTLASEAPTALPSPYSVIVEK